MQPGSWQPTWRSAAGQEPGAGSRGKVKQMRQQGQRGREGKMQCRTYKATQRTANEGERILEESTMCIMPARNVWGQRQRDVSVKTLPKAVFK